MLLQENVPAQKLNKNRYTAPFNLLLCHVVPLHNLGRIHYENNTLFQWQKRCWPLPSRTRADRVSLLKDNGPVTFLARPMIRRWWLIPQLPAGDPGDGSLFQPFPDSKKKLFLFPPEVYSAWQEGRRSSHRRRSLLHPWEELHHLLIHTSRHVMDTEGGSCWWQWGK